MCLESEGYERQHVCVNRTEIMKSTLEGMKQGISFIISPSTAALSHRKTVSARTAIKKLSAVV